MTKYSPTEIRDLISTGLIDFYVNVFCSTLKLEDFKGDVWLWKLARSHEEYLKGEFGIVIKYKEIAWINGESIYTDIELTQYLDEQLTMLKLTNG